MIAQYTQAAIVSELKRLAVPASVDSIPSSAMQEDHVSMGWSAARKLRRSVDGLTRVVAIEVHDRGPRARHARPARALRRPRSPSSTPCAPPASRAPAPTATCPPRSRLPWNASARAPSSPPPKTRSENCNERRREPPPADPRRHRHRPDLRVVADRGAAADADEQPRPGQRRAARGPRRLRRHGQGRAQLGGVRRARARRCARSRTTRRCSSRAASRSASCAPTSGLRAC